MASTAHARRMEEVTCASPAWPERGEEGTLDRRTAVIVALVMDDLLPAARAILAELCTIIACTEVEAPPGDLDDWMMRELRADSNQ